uniref:Uncharacterized protein n=1 Tax=Oryza brachyantha TaxID=4533 RepID=J3KXG2_ORYBR
VETVALRRQQTARATMKEMFGCIVMPNWRSIVKAAPLLLGRDTNVTTRLDSTTSIY